jgi:hypothetical protein
LEAVCGIDVATLLAANPSAQPKEIIETERLKVITATKLEFGDNG